MGPSIATEIILKSKLSSEYDLIHLDTSDRRELTNLGKIDFWNIYLALKHYVQLFYLIAFKKPAIVYIPISQTTIGYLRDSGFILIAKAFRRKVVCHLRGGNFRNWYDSAGKAVQRFVSLVHGVVDAQIVLGESLRSLFYGLLPEERIFVVPNGGDYRFGSQSISNEKITVLFLANFIRTKGVIDTLLASHLIQSNGCEVEYLFAGSWLEKDTQEEFERLLLNKPDVSVGVIEKVHGQQKIRLLSDADIFVFPTYYPPEGHPWVIIEAMAAGLPIITTNQGAIPESVIDGVNGFLVEKKSPEAIAEKIELLVRDKYLRMRMGGASRQRYLEEFTEDRMAEKMITVFRKVLEY